MAAGAIFPSPGNRKDGLSGQSFGKMLPNFRAIRGARASARSAKPPRFLHQFPAGLDHRLHLLRQRIADPLLSASLPARTYRSRLSDLAGRLDDPGEAPGPIGAVLGEQAHALVLPDDQHLVALNFVEPVRSGRNLLAGARHTKFIRNTHGPKKDNPVENANLRQERAAPTPGIRIWWSRCPHPAGIHPLRANRRWSCARFDPASILTPYFWSSSPVRACWRRHAILPRRSDDNWRRSFSTRR